MMLHEAREGGTNMTLPKSQLYIRTTIALEGLHKTVMAFQLIMVLVFCRGIFVFSPHLCLSLQLQDDTHMDNIGS
jgi:hypothetical protein